MGYVNKKNQKLLFCGRNSFNEASQQSKRERRSKNGYEGASDGNLQRTSSLGDPVDKRRIRVAVRVENYKRGAN